MTNTKFSKVQWGDGLEVSDEGDGVIRVDGTGGPAGVTGATGATGAAGATGATGATGPPGADGADGADGVGVPTGGTTGQVLTKDTGTDFDTSWQTPSAVATKQFLAREYGPMPGSVGSVGMYRVPYFAGSSVTFTLSRASLHLEEVGSTSTVLVIEKSTTADWFNPTVIATLTVTASNYSATDVTSSLGTLASGNLIRFRWTSLGTGADSYHAQLEGTE